VVPSRTPGKLLRFFLTRNTRNPQEILQRDRGKLLGLHGISAVLPFPNTLAGRVFGFLSFDYVHATYPVASRAHLISNEEGIVRGVYGSGTPIPVGSLQESLKFHQPLTKIGAARNTGSVGCGGKENSEIVGRKICCLPQLVCNVNGAGLISTEAGRIVYPTKDLGGGEPPSCKLASRGGCCSAPISR